MLLTIATAIALKTPTAAIPLQIDFPGLLLPSQWIATAPGFLAAAVDTSVAIGLQHSAFFASCCLPPWVVVIDPTTVARAEICTAGIAAAFDRFNPVTATASTAG